MNVEICVTFLVVAVETDGLNGETGTQLFRVESSSALPRKDEMYDVEGTFQLVRLVKHSGKRAGAPKHCAIEIHINKMEFAQLKRDNSWRDSVYEAFQQGIVG